MEHYVPVWLERPPQEAEALLVEPLREFYRAIDGKADLASLLSGISPEERAQRMDWLVLQFRSRALVLLPMPVAEIERRGSAGASSGERDPWWRGIAPRRD